MKKIIIGLIAGIVLAVFTKFFGIGEIELFSLLGAVYIFALKAIAPVLVYLMVIDCVSHMDGSDILQKKGIIRVIILYLISSIIASFIAVFAAKIFPCKIPGLDVKTNVSEQFGGQGSIYSIILSIVENPISAIINGNYLAVLFWATTTGIICRKVSDTTKLLIKDFTYVVTQIVKLIVKLAPFGIFGLIYSSIYKNGIEVFYEYGKLIILLVSTMLFVAFVSNPIIVAVCIKKNPYPLLFRCLKDSAINAFFTRSSAANIPINLDLCKSLNLNERVYSITIPLGSTINMAGAAVVITIMTMCTNYTLGKECSILFAILMCIVATLAAAGTAGTAGGSLMLIPFACSLFGIPVDAAWFTVGVGEQISFIQDSVETAINSSSDVLFTATAEMMERSKN